MYVTTDYRIVSDNITGKHYNLICESFFIRNSIGYLFDITLSEEMLKLMMKDDIIESYRIEKENIYIKEKQCILNNKKCCCLCLYNKIYPNDNKCDNKKEHGICQEYVQI